MILRILHTCAIFHVNGLDHQKKKCDRIDACQLELVTASPKTFLTNKPRKQCFNNNDSI